MGKEFAADELAHQVLVDRGAVEDELVAVLGQGQSGNRHLVLDRARLLLRDLSLKQVADNRLRFVRALDGNLDGLVVGGPHAEELQLAHGGEDLLAFHHTILLRLS